MQQPPYFANKGCCLNNNHILLLMAVNAVTTIYSTNNGSNNHILLMMALVRPLATVAFKIGLECKRSSSIDFLSALQIYATWSQSRVEPLTTVDGKRIVPERDGTTLNLLLVLIPRFTMTFVRRFQFTCTSLGRQEHQQFSRSFGDF